MPRRRAAVHGGATLLAVLPLVAAPGAAAQPLDAPVRAAVRLSADQPPPTGVLLQRVPRVPRAAAVALVKPVVMSERGAYSRPVRAILRLRGLPPGSIRSLVGTLVAGAPNQRVLAFGNKITCREPGRRISTQLWNGINLVQGRGDVTLHLREFVTVPPGGALDCALLGSIVTHVGAPGAKAALRGGWLADLGSAGRAPTALQTVLTESDNALVPLTGREVTVAAVARYVPTGTARHLRVTGDVYLTECHSTGDSFCPPGHRYPAYGAAAASTWVLASPAALPGCRARSSRPVLTIIDSAVHHTRAESTLLVPVLGTQCAPWTVVVKARSIGGSSPYVISLEDSYSAVTVSALRS